MTVAVHNKENKLYRISPENSLNKQAGAGIITNRTNNKSWGEGGNLIIRVATLYHLKQPVINKNFDT